jgi:hypothetical protein
LNNVSRRIKIPMSFMRSFFMKSKIPSCHIRNVNYGDLNTGDSVVDRISRYCKEDKLDYIMGREYKETGTAKLGNLFDKSYVRFLSNKIEPWVLFEMYIKYDNRRMERFIQSELYIGNIPKIYLVNFSGNRSKELEALSYLKKNNIQHI